MSYIVLARRLRPQSFEEVIGQEHISTTLKNAIKLNRVAHAYLFSGPRGVGKTSTARIFAKALNCAKGPTASPCNECVNCKEIQESRSLDVIEIDGASNRGIDEVRNLRDAVKFLPNKGAFKIYIIDEVHMLTTEAFNALLKTLEEPPAHVKFIFATTAPHKVLPTILSRCQRFDFRRIAISELSDKLKEIAKHEKLNIDDDAIYVIAKAASGSMRDAESVLDQLISFSKGHIRAKDAAGILGLVNEEALFGIMEALIKKDVVSSLKIVKQVSDEGKDLAQFINSLIEHIRNLLLLRIDKKLHDLVDAPKDSIEPLYQQAIQFSQEELLYIFSVIINLSELLKRSVFQKILVEATLIKLANRSSLNSFDAILAKIAQLEKASPAQAISVETRSARDAGIVATREQTTQANKNVQISFDKLKQMWPVFLNLMRSKKISLYHYLCEGAIKGMQDNVLSISFPKRSHFHKETLEKNINKDLIEGMLNQVAQADIRVNFEFDSETAEAVLPNAGSTEPATSPQGDDIVDSAMKIFAGKLVNEDTRQDI